jgi:integrase
MARTLNRLTDRFVKTVKSPGRHADGGGLYLRVRTRIDRATRAPVVFKTWVLRYASDENRKRDGTVRRRERDMGLGAYPGVSLADAREKARKKREARAHGNDPIQAHKAEIAATKRALAGTKTFDACVEQYLDDHRAKWSPKHDAQWRSTLKRYAAPVIGDLAIAAIDTDGVMRVLQPIWQEKKLAVAVTLRGRLEKILDWARVKGFRTGENPARWRGHLDNLLPPRSAVRKVKHHPALPYREIGDFMATLRQREGAVPRALEFMILTATRSSEALGARWSEIDLAARSWVIPAERMKSGREHRVPLSDAALSVLRRMETIRVNDHVFPGERRERPSHAAFFDFLRKRMGREDITAHGFRSSFRDWCAEQTNVARELAEAALAHVNSDKVEAAYQRGDLFEKRRRLMTQWAAFCFSGDTTGKVIPIKSRQSRLA